MEQTRKYTLRDYLRAINVMEEDKDVYVDGIDGIAACAPLKLTPEGEERFKEALDLPMDGNTVVSDDDDDYEEDEEDGQFVEGSRLQLAWELLTGLAGYVAVSKFNRWFDGENAKEI